MREKNCSGGTSVITGYSHCSIGPLLKRLWVVPICLLLQKFCKKKKKINYSYKTELFNELFRTRKVYAVFPRTYLFYRVFRRVE